MKLVLNPKTEQALKRIIESQPQAILITGSKGTGKKSFSRYLAAQLLGIDDLDSYPYYLALSTQAKAAISIEDIRTLEHFLTLKVPYTQTLNRICIINGADSLTLEAQNALLKTLEEPPEGTVLILNASQPTRLLPTILSRLQRLHLASPAEAALKTYFTGIPAEQFERAYLMSGGRPGLLSAMLSNEAHPLNEATETARKILSHNLYDRLLMVNDLSKDTGKLSDTLQIIGQMAEINLGRGVNEARWQKILTSAHDSRAALSRNAQTKLVALNFMLHLG